MIQVYTKQETRSQKHTQFFFFVCFTFRVFSDYLLKVTHIEVTVKISLVQSKNV